jgi:hypothetical protein
MSIALRKHNARVSRENWWRTYFWSQHEYWAKFAVSKAAHRAKVAKLNGNGSYFYWSQVSLRAAAFCERNYGPVPELLTRRPIRRSVWALSSAEVNRWLSMPPLFRSRKSS